MRLNTLTQFAYTSEGLHAALSPNSCAVLSLNDDGDAKLSLMQVPPASLETFLENGKLCLP